MVFKNVGDSRHLYSELCFSSSEVRLSFTLDFHLPVQFLGGRRRERKVQWCPTASEPRGVYHVQAGRTLGSGGWGAGEGWKGTQLLSMNETISHGSAKLHEVPVYPC